MDTIIAGNFEHREQADVAARALLGAGVADVCAFAVNAEGQHHGLALGGDVDADPQAESGGKGGVTGALIGTAVGAGIGLAAVPLAPIVAPALVLGTAAAGAYTGAMAGAVSNMGSKDGTADETAPSRQAGVLVAVRAIDADGEALATRVLREHGARDIERAQGTWRDGQWADFDPVRRPELV
jgi:hypothetical protein